MKIQSTFVQKNLLFSYSVFYTFICSIFQLQNQFFVILFFLHFIFYFHINYFIVFIYFFLISVFKILCWHRITKTKRFKYCKMYCWYLCKSWSERKSGYCEGVSVVRVCVCLLSVSVCVCVFVNWFFNFSVCVWI